MPACRPPGSGPPTSPTRRRAYELAADLARRARWRRRRRAAGGGPFTMDEPRPRPGPSGPLGRSGNRPPGGVPPAPLGEEREELLERLRLQTARRLPTSATVDALDRVEEEIRRRGPEHDGAVLPRAPGAPESAPGIRARRLDPGTTLLQYALGDDRKLALAGAAGGAGSPSSAAPGKRSKPSLGAPTVSSRPEPPAAVGWTGGHWAELAETVLGPLAGKLGEERLVIAADGALHYIPVRRPCPCPRARRAPGSRFWCGTKWSTCPRSRRSLPSAPGRDSRRKGHWSCWPTRSSIPKIRGSNPRSRQSPASPRFIVSRRAARKRKRSPPCCQRPPERFSSTPRRAGKRFSAEVLRAFRWVHFATHGLDRRRPSRTLGARALPGGCLRPESRRLPQSPGHLLSGAGRRAGGALGLPHRAPARRCAAKAWWGSPAASFHAGAPRVVASLWQVEDRATAELMRRFYRALLVDEPAPGRRPPGRHSSLSGQRTAGGRRRTGRHSSLQGDWR